MPTYEYQCAACGHAFELFQQMSDSLKRKCPKCGKPRLERLIGTGAGIIFKGGGFYQTDYRSDSYKKGAEAETKAKEPAKDAGAAKPEPKSETAPAAPSAEPPAKKSKGAAKKKGAAE